MKEETNKRTCSCGREGFAMDICPSCKPELYRHMNVSGQWQKCPICEGSGSELGTGYCARCNGEKIIHTQSALPPSKHKIV
jgi:DnaJ-class molecular chaperone